MASAMEPPLTAIHPPHQPAKSDPGIRSKVQTFPSLPLNNSRWNYWFLFGSTTSIDVLNFLYPWWLFNVAFSLRFFVLASSRKRRKGNGSGSSNQEPQPKNAVAILNELKKNLVYELESQEGPYHQPIFTISVMVSEQLGSDTVGCQSINQSLNSPFYSFFFLSPLLWSLLGRWSKVCWSGEVEEACTNRRREQCIARLHPIQRSANQERCHWY